MRSAGRLSEDENVDDALHMARAFAAIDECPAPVVCRAHGAAFGGGIGLVACADIAIASEDCVFAFSETRIGVIPAVISRYAIPAIGERAARRYFVTGERFDATTALRIGLVHGVAPDVDTAVSTVLAEILAAGPEAAREAKALVRDRPDQAEAARRVAHRRASAEGQEGLAAFLERRPPAWRSDGSS
jgi:methylglutaconyl-CoA hydratase